jgi:hypothetical protein
MTKKFALFIIKIKIFPLTYDFGQDPCRIFKYEYELVYLGTGSLYIEDDVPSAGLRKIGIGSEFLFSSTMTP